MAKLPDLHPYSDRSSFARLMLLIATFLRYPGVGSRDPLEPPGTHNALAEVQQRLIQVAEELAIPLTHYSLATLRKDLKTLRQYGLLDSYLYRWGYYLGTGAMNRDELKLLMHSLYSQGARQGDRKAKQVYDRLMQRMRGLNLELKGELLYPVRQTLNRPVNLTDPDEMIRHNDRQDNLFHQLDAIETAIQQGQAVELVYQSAVYDQNNLQQLRVFPLQLAYADVAWYLLCDHCDTGHFSTYRINRLKNFCQPIASQHRSLDQQRQRLDQVHGLLHNGWGLFLGNPADQQAELDGTLPLELVKVRFFPPASRFILEGDRRHPRQTIRSGAKDPQTQEARYVDYSVTLPGRSLSEFSHWVSRHGASAKVLSPPALVEKFQKQALELFHLYHPASAKKR